MLTAGQALTEFALIIPLFLIVLLALVDTGRLVYSYNTLNQAAREGSRVAAVQAAWINVTPCGLPAPGCPPDTATFRQRTLGGVNRMTVGLGSVADGNLTITCTSPNGSSADCAGNNLSGDSTVSVNVSFSFKPIIGQVFQPIFGWFRLAPTITLASSSSMTVN